MPYADPEVQAEYQRQWMANRRAEWFADKSCSWCGSTQNLELDHVDSASKVSHRIWSWSRARRDAELAKCQVLCNECHTAKSLSMDNTTFINGFVHGSRSMYQIHRCRCEKCKAWQSARLAKQCSNRAAVAQMAEHLPGT